MKILVAIMLFWSTLNLAAQENQSLRLEDALNQALQNNYGIIIIQKSNKIAGLQNVWGNTGALPNIQFLNSGYLSQNFEDSDDYSTKQLNSSVEMNWAVFRGFSARIRKDKLDELERLSEGNAAVVVENTIFGVILAYYNILLADERTEIAGKNMVLSRDRYKRGKHSHEIGVMDTYELLQAKNAYLKDSADFLSAKASYRNAVRQLNYHMAEPLDRMYNFTSEFSPDTTAFQYSALVDRMLENNNTLENQYMNLELARLDVKSAKSAFYPTLSLTGSGGYSALEQDYETMNQFDQSRSGFNTAVGVSLSYTIYDGNSRKRALNVAKLEKEISEVETEEMKQDLKNQLAQEYELYRVHKQLLRLPKKICNQQHLIWNCHAKNLRTEPSIPLISGMFNRFTWMLPTIIEMQYLMSS